MECEAERAFRAVMQRLEQNPVIPYHKYIPQTRVPAQVKVRPSDIIVADEDGIAVVPRDKAKEVLAKSEELDQTEHKMYPFIERFKSIRKAVEEFGRI